MNERLNGTEVVLGTIVLIVLFLLGIGIGGAKTQAEKKALLDCVDRGNDLGYCYELTQ